MFFHVAAEGELELACLARTCEGGVMRVARFEFAPGSRFQAGAQASAAEVGAHIELLRAQFKGELTPKDVLDDARNPNSPSHGFFEWDDSAAAEAYRLSQARGLIRSIVLSTRTMVARAA